MLAGFKEKVKRLEDNLDHLLFLANNEGFTVYQYLSFYLSILEIRDGLKVERDFLTKTTLTKPILKDISDTLKDSKIIGLMSGNEVYDMDLFYILKDTLVSHKDSKLNFLKGKTEEDKLFCNLDLELKDTRILEDTMWLYERSFKHRYDRKHLYSTVTMNLRTILSRTILNIYSPFCSCLEILYRIADIEKPKTLVYKKYSKIIEEYETLISKYVNSKDLEYDNYKFFITIEFSTLLLYLIIVFEIGFSETYTLNIDKDQLAKHLDQITNYMFWSDLLVENENPLLFIKGKNLNRYYIDLFIRYSKFITINPVVLDNVKNHLYKDRDDKDFEFLRDKLVKISSLI